MADMITINELTTEFGVTPQNVYYLVRRAQMLYPGKCKTKTIVKPNGARHVQALTKSDAEIVRELFRLTKRHRVHPSAVSAESQR